jgi:hypothetical protein
VGGRPLGRSPKPSGCALGGDAVSRVATHSGDSLKLGRPPTRKVPQPQGAAQGEGAPQAEDRGGRRVRSTLLDAVVPENIEPCNTVRTQPCNTVRQMGKPSLQNRPNLVELCPQRRRQIVGKKRKIFLRQPCRLRPRPCGEHIAGHLAKAQSELSNPEKSLVATIGTDRPGEGARTFRYAPLSSGLDIVRKALGQQQIATVQATAIDAATGTINLTTVKPCAARPDVNVPGCS